MAEQIQFSSAFVILDDFLELLLHIAHINQGFGEFIANISEALELHTGKWRETERISIIGNGSWNSVNICTQCTHETIAALTLCSLDLSFIFAFDALISSSCFSFSNVMMWLLSLIISMRISSLFSALPAAPLLIAFIASISRLSRLFSSLYVCS